MESSARTSRTRRTPRHRPPPHTQSASTASDDTQTGQFPRVTGHRRTILRTLAAVSLLAATALVLGLSWVPDPAESSRLPTADERTRLAAVRVTNYRDLRAGVHLTAGTGAARTDLVGWVDWSRPLLYLDLGGPGMGAQQGLLQATPTVLLLRPDHTTPAPLSPAPPPLVPPADGWRLATPPATDHLRPLLDLLFALATDRADPPARETARWIASAGGTDVLAAGLPPAQPGAPTPSATDVHWWVDREARLHRLEAQLPDLGPVTVRLNRADRPTLRPVEALGGQAGTPRPLSAAERRRLASLPTQLRTAGETRATLTALLGSAANLRGTGWINWSRRSAYLAVDDLDSPRRRTLIRHERGRTTQTELPAAINSGVDPVQPPLPIPTTGWEPAPDAGLAALLDAALRAATPAEEGTARRIRGDRLADTELDVVEVVAAVGKPIRYWLDRSGLPHRLQLATAAGTWAQVDLIFDDGAAS
ncbi:hypothetical protein [Salinispora cortesiana]|uniref:hypothetical protein n=1 Tax=Salinispora cortesiana TaxID=1305843 RepID=UPI0003F8A887|nr:hypothetical protein [Salinispora cortesiana]